MPGGVVTFADGCERFYDEDGNETGGSIAETHEPGSHDTQPVAPAIPGPATNAAEMAARLTVVAHELQRLGIKPVSLSVGHAYLWGLPGHPDARDAVKVQPNKAREFLRLEAVWELSRDEITRDDDGRPVGNVDASGFVAGVAVAIYHGAADVLAVEAVSA